MADDASPSHSNTSISGGVNLDADRIDIGGDVVGRDKIVSTTILTGDQQYDVHGLANPYLGLQSFTYADHAKYAGREKLIAETVARLTAPDDPLALLFVTGASGSGKSSFVQAGVLPTLKEYYRKQNLEWAVFRPSRDPLAALTDAAWRLLGLPQFEADAASSVDFGNFLKAHTPPQQINVIVIDQFEELFTQSAAQPRDGLFTLLTQLSPFRSTRTHIIVTVRADYLPELFTLPGLYDIAKQGVDLRAMGVDELRGAIQQPLQATYPDTDRRFQAELVDRLAQDASEDAAYLTLLQVTLEEIWRKGTLTVGSYTNLSDAIKQRANKVLAYQDYDAARPDQPRPPEEQAAILNLCLELVDVSLDDEARRDVRRRRSKDELSSGEPDRARLIDVLTQARLLSAGLEPGEQPHVEVDLIHETLLANWDRLRQAIAERRHELHQRVRFEQQLKEWIGQNRSDEYLLSGIRLAEARELEHRDDVALRSATARDFVHRCIAHEEARREKELEDARKLVEAEQLRAEEQAQSASKLRQRAIYLMGALGVALLLGIAAGVFGVQSNQHAAEAGRNAATAQAASTLAVGQLAAQAVSKQDDHLALSLLLSIEAAQITNTAEARASLLAGLQHSPHLKGYLRGLSGTVSELVFSPNSQLLVAADVYGDSRLWDLSDADLSRPVSSVSLGEIEPGSAFSPDGKLFVANDSSRTTVWNVSNPRQPFQTVALSLTGWLQAISSDGQFLTSADFDGAVYLWNAANLEQPRRLAVLNTGRTGQACAIFSPDSRKVFTTGPGDTIILWDISDPEAPHPIGDLLHGHTETGCGMAVSHRHSLLAFSGNDHRVQLWTLADPQVPVELPDALGGHTDQVDYLEFSADDQTLTTAVIEDQTLVRWDLSDPAEPRRIEPALMTQEFVIPLSAAANSDGTLLALGGCRTLAGVDCLEGEVLVWDVSEASTRWPLSQNLPGAIDNAVNGAISPDGKTLAVGGSDGTIRLWDISNPREPELSRQTLSGPTKPLAYLKFSPDGRYLVSGSKYGEVLLWATADYHQPLRLVSPSDEPGDTIAAADFDQRSQRLVVSTLSGSVHIFDVADLRPPLEAQTPADKQVQLKASINLAAFITDTNTVLVQGAFGLQVMDAVDLTRVSSPLKLLEEFAAVSQDGKILVAGGGQFIKIFDITDPLQPRPLASFYSDQANTYLDNLALSPDGRTLASSDFTGRINLWDISDTAGPVKLGSLQVPEGNKKILFSPAGEVLAVVGETDVILWDLHHAAWVDRACRIAGRNFTRAEWQQYMGDEVYRKTCEQWPLEPEATPGP